MLHAAHAVGAKGHIFCNRLLGREKERYYRTNLLLSFSTKPAAGATSPEKTTDRGYELRSRGPATRGFDALDTSEDVEPKTATEGKKKKKKKSKTDDSDE